MHEEMRTHSFQRVKALPEANETGEAQEPRGVYWPGVGLVLEVNGR